MTVKLDILAINRGMVTAPAGCGKTYLIVDALSRYDGAKPVLVLTHTNAGVVALRERIRCKGIPSKVFRLHTIDGWAMRLVASFPKRSMFDPSTLKLVDIDYPTIRKAAVRILEKGHIDDILAATYSRLIVDEYQDCTIHQHSIVVSVSRILPVCILGDSMQAIFGFGQDQLVSWQKAIACFPIAGELKKPFRWINAGTEPLGNWLLEVRERLLHGEPVDLRKAPKEVEWVIIDGEDDYGKRYKAVQSWTNQGGSILVIGDSDKPAKLHEIAKRMRSASVVEPVQLANLFSFAKKFNITGPDALQQLLYIAKKVMTGTDAAQLLKSVQSSSGKKPKAKLSDKQRVALLFYQSPSYGAAVNLLTTLKSANKVKVYRPTLLWSLIQTLQLCEVDGELSLYDAAIKIREQYRVIGRKLPKIGVGSTLLVKGLESQAVMILNPDNMDAKNLYVAMTRGSKKLIICCSKPILVKDSPT